MAYPNSLFTPDCPIGSYYDFNIFIYYCRENPLPYPWLVGKASLK